MQKPFSNNTIQGQAALFFGSETKIAIRLSSVLTQILSTQLSPNEVTHAEYCCLLYSALQFLPFSRNFKISFDKGRFCIFYFVIIVVYIHPIVTITLFIMKRHC